MLLFYKSLAIKIRPVYLNKVSFEVGVEFVGKKLFLKLIESKMLKVFSWSGSLSESLKLSILLSF